MPNDEQKTTILERIYKNFTFISSITAIITFIVGAVIQIVFLHSHNGGSYFSISQTVIDVLNLTSYLFVFLVVPLFLMFFLTGWRIRRMEEKKKKRMGLNLVFICFAYFALIAFPPIEGEGFLAFSRHNFIGYIVMLILGLSSIFLYEMTFALKIFRDDKKADLTILLLLVIATLGACIIVPFIAVSLSFEISRMNFGINVLFMTFVSVLFARLAEGIISLRKEKEKIEDEKMKFTRKHIFLIPVVIYLLIIFVFAPILYIGKLMKGIHTQFNEFGSVSIESTQYEILYKNDKYVFVPTSGMQEIKVVPIGEVDYFINQKKETNYTLDNFIEKTNKFKFLLGDLFNKVWSSIKERSLGLLAWEKW